MGAYRQTKYEMTSPLALPLDEHFLKEVAKFAAHGRAVQQLMHNHELALDAECLLFDGADAEHASDCRLKADEVRTKKRLHSELTSALDDFVQGARRLKQAHLRSHVKQSLLARHSHKENEQRCAQASLDNILDSIFVDSFAAA